MARESTSRTNDYDDFIQPHEELEFSDCGRDEASGIVKVGVWLAILGICGTVWTVIVLAFARYAVPFFQKLQLM